MSDALNPPGENPVDRIVRPEPAALRVVWPNEAHDFTPWLARNLDWLDDVLDIGALKLTGVEVQIPGYQRNLDILATAPDGTKVAIENQYRKVDHDHLTRGLAYTLGLDCGALVIIAEDHGGEFVAIADYLNRAYETLGAGKGVAVYLLTVKVQKVGEHFLPTFEVAARPNAWLTEAQSGGPLPRAGSSSVDGFLDRCTPDFRRTATEIIAEWNQRPGTSLRVNPQASVVTLDHPYGRGGHQSVFVLYTNGTITLNRGYYIESGAVDESMVPEMDSVMADCFGDLSDKPYYRSARGGDAAGVARFADWLIAHDRVTEEIRGD